MNEKQMKSLQPGDVIKHKLGNTQFVVMANYGDRVTAVRTVDMTNPSEWEIISKVTQRKLEF